MYKLVSCCLLFIGSLNPLLSLPVLDSRQESLKFLDPITNIFYPRGNMRKAFSGQDPKLFLSDLLSRIRKQSKKRGPSSECFWKYCV